MYLILSCSWEIAVSLVLCLFSCSTAPCRDANTAEADMMECTESRSCHTAALRCSADVRGASSWDWSATSRAPVPSSRNYLLITLSLPLRPHPPMFCVLIILAERGGLLKSGSSSSSSSSNTVRTAWSAVTVCRRHSSLRII